MTAGFACVGRRSWRGRDDIRAVGDSLAASEIAVGQMLVSPMSRARESAELLAAALAPDDVRVNERLVAKNSGHLGEKSGDLAAVEATRQGMPIHQLRSPGGDSSEDVQARYVRLLNDVCSGPHRTTVLVGHGGGIACLLLHLTGQSLGRYLEYVPESAGLTWIEVDEGRPRIQVMNARPTALTDHLQLTARAAR